MMPSTTSASIDIDGSQACGQEKVSRTMPAILSGRITSGDWTALCDALDDALKPTSGVKKLTYAWNVVVPLIMVIFVLFGFLGFASQEHRSFNWSSIVVVVLVAVLGNLCILVIIWIQKNKIHKRLVAACDKTAARHPGISFHVRFDMRMGRQNNCDNRDNDDDCCDSNNERRRNHIEVCVAPMATSNASYTSSLSPAPVAVAEAYVVPSATAFAIPSAPPKSAVVHPYDDPEIPIVREKKTAEERMIELDRMRHIITNEEYHRKRAEILSDI